jgi:NADPH-dependent ferric siderophore reductase
MLTFRLMNVHEEVQRQTGDITMQTMHQTKGRILNDGGAAIAALRSRAAEWEIPLEEEPSRTCFSVWNSQATLYPDDSGLLVELRSPEERLLRTLQDSLTQLFDEHGLTTAWDDVKEGALAPGLALMQVTSVTRRSPGFIRVRLEGPEAARFGANSLHFRLLLPPRGREPRWPRIAASGRTIWPEGEDALHRPVYTTAAQEGDWLDFDIFRHPGSPTSDWAEENPVGQTVGIVGPGGGWCPEASSLLLFGDETALPAIARMLALATGEVRAYVQVAPENLCELAGDCRVSSVADLNAALEECGAAPGCHVWFAGHADAARKARTHLSARGFNKRDFTAVAYWS